MKRLIRLYPERWQARYGAEFEAIIEARSPSFSDRIDIVRGAVDARVHPQVRGTGESDVASPPVSVLAGVLVGLGGLSWAIASGIVGTAGITASGYLDAEAAGAFMLAAVILIPLGTSIALIDLPSAVARRGGALNLAFLVSAVAIWMLPWPMLGAAAFLAVACFIASGLHHAIVAARARWVPGVVAAVAIVTTMAGAFGFVGVLMFGLSGPMGISSFQELFRVLYAAVAATSGFAWTLIGAFMVRRSRGNPSAIESGGTLDG